MFITVLAHELGHLIFGLITGYRFLSLTLFGVTVSRTRGRLRLSKSGHFVYGQCLMYPAKPDADPKLMIAGGVLMNLVMVMLNVFCLAKGLSGGMNDETEVIMLFCCELMIFNVTGIIGNLVCGSDTSDGATLREARSDPDNCRCYNNIMLISKETVEGHRADELRREELLSPAMSVRSGLARELRDMIMNRERSEG